MTTSGEILARTRAVLLDFDGPVCAVFGGLSNRYVANELRDMFHGSLPKAVDSSSDPFEVLNYAAQLEGLARPVELRLRELEVEAVQSAPPTDGASEVLAHFTRERVPVVIVSNNSKVAVEAYLDAHGLQGQVVGISARETADPQMLKPNPFLLRQAMSFINEEPGNCLMIGDSTTDIKAARSAETLTVGFANKAGKRERLARCKPDLIIDQMTELIADSL